MAVNGDIWSQRRIITVRLRQVTRVKLLTSSSMHAQVITFGLNGITEEQFREACGADAPTFANLPGLLAKIWLRDPETNTFGPVALLSATPARWDRPPMPLGSQPEAWT